MRTARRGLQPACWVVFSTLQRKKNLCYDALALTDHCIREARWGFEPHQRLGPRIKEDADLWLRPDAPFWQWELQQRRRPPCRGYLPSSRAKEELAGSMKEALFVSTMRRPALASRCCCFRAEG